MVHRRTASLYSGVLVRDVSLLALGASLYTLAFPPYEWTWAAWLALTPLFLVLRDTTPRTAFVAGCVYAILWCMGVGYWVFLTIAAYFPLAFPLNIVFVLANYTFFAGLPTGVVALFSCLLLRRGNPWLTALGIPALWVSGEVLRANPWFGVSWGILGYTQYRHLALIQIADITSVYGLSFFIALGNYVVAEMWNTLAHKNSPQSTVRSQEAGGRIQNEKSAIRNPQSAIGGLPWRALGILTAGILLALGYGTVRLRQYDAAPSTPALRVAIVQGNVPSAYRWQPAHYASTLLKYASITSRGVRGSQTDLVVWPEFAASFYLDKELLLRAQLGQFAQMTNTALLLGAPRMEESDTGIRYYNSAYLLSSNGELVDVYDKIRLVPFAEYRPLSLPAVLNHSAEAPSEFTSGTRATVFSLPQGTFGVTICYEAAYPSLSRRLVQEGAQLLVNISNDTWLGGAAVAIEQHFAMAVLRAVENKRSLVRAATAGISGFVDPTGRLHALSAEEETVIHGAVSPQHGLTIYARYGDWFALVCLGFSLAVLVSLTWRRETVEQSLCRDYRRAA